MPINNIFFLFGTYRFAHVEYGYKYQYGRYSDFQTSTPNISFVAMYMIPSGWFSAQAPGYCLCRLSLFTDIPHIKS